MFRKCLVAHLLSVIEFSRSNQSLSEFFSVELEFIEEFHILGIDVLVLPQARGLSVRVLRSDFHLFVRGCQLKVSRTVPYALPSLLVYTLCSIAYVDDCCSLCNFSCLCLCNLTMPWHFSVDLYAILVVYAFSVFALAHYAQYVDHIRFLMLAILYLP